MNVSVATAKVGIASLIPSLLEMEPAQPTLTALYQVRSVMLLLENAKSDVPTIQTVLLMVSATSKAALVVCLRTTVREAYAQQTSTAPVALADLTANVSFDSTRLYFNIIKILTK